jgi:hypothetical protein
MGFIERQQLKKLNDVASQEARGQGVQAMRREA